MIDYILDPLEQLYLEILYIGLHLEDMILITRTNPTFYISVYRLWDNNVVAHHVVSTTHFFVTSTGYCPCR